MKKYLIILFIFFAFPAFAKTDVPEVITTKNGFSAWLIEDHYLPIVSIKITFPNSGFAYDQKEKQGLAYMVASLVDEGSGGLSSLEYRKKLEELATSINFSVSEDSFYVTVQTLKENLPDALQLVNNALIAAHFEPESIERIRNQIIVMQAKQLEDPEYLAVRKFKEEIFGQHPYANLKNGNKESIKAIKREDLINFTKSNFIKENMQISIVGDVSKKDVISLLDGKMNIPSGKKQEKSLPEVVLNTKSRIIHVEKDIPQSVIIFGGKGVKRKDSDFYPAYIMNHLLGGGGSESRLMDEVREKNGLAYTVYSYLELLKDSGLFVGYAGTDASKATESIGLIKKQLNDLQKNGAKNNEIQNAKDYLVNSFPLRMTKNSAIADYLAVMQEENLGMDFLKQRNNYIKNVSPEQINAAAAKLLNDEQIIFIVVGK